MIYLNRPDLVLGETTIPLATLLNPTLARVAWGLAIGLFVAGAVCLLLTCRGAAAGSSAVFQAGAGWDHERGRLEVEIPLSVHKYLPWKGFSRVMRRVAFAAFLFLLSLVALPCALFALDRGSASVAVMVLVLGLLFNGTTFAVIWRAAQQACGVSEIVVCHSGLRWRIGTQQARALWADIASVHLHHKVNRAGEGLEWAGTCTIKFRSGAAPLYLWTDTLSNFIGFIKAVEVQVNAVNGEVASRAMGEAFRSPYAGGRART
jgi:hypothetical protein